MGGSPALAGLDLEQSRISLLSESRCAPGLRMPAM
jgi:hypothetical protein